MKIRFVTGNDWMSNLIRIGERDGWCTHAEAVLPDGSLLGAHLQGGVLIRPPGYDKATTTRELIVPIATTHERNHKFCEFLHAQLGKPYDLRAVFGLQFGRSWRDGGHWFCSELMAAALEACGWLPPLSAVNNHVSPRDLLLVLSGIMDIPAAA